MRFLEDITNEIGYNPVKRVEALKYDLEYWYSYIHSYENDEIACSKTEKENDIKRCKHNYKLCLNKINYELDTYPELFV